MNTSVNEATRNPDPWWKTCVWFSFFSMVAASLFWLPMWQFAVVFSIGLIVFVVTLYYNPRYWYRRTSWAIVAFICMATGLPGLNFEFKLPDGNAAILLERTDSTLVGLTILAVLAIVFAYFDWKTTLNYERDVDPDARIKTSLDDLTSLTNAVPEKDRVDVVHPTLSARFRRRLDIPAKPSDTAEHRAILRL